MKILGGVEKKGKMRLKKRVMGLLVKLLSDFAHNRLFTVSGVVECYK